MRVKLTSEQKIQVLNARDIFLIMQQILLRENKIGRGKEHLWIVCLSELNKIILIDLLRFGAGNAGPMDPADVFGFALQKQARKLILVQNHPREAAPVPSKADMDFADRMYQVGKFFNLPVLDHLIINEEKYFSFAETGVLKKLAGSGKYALHLKPGPGAARKKGKARGKKRKT